MFILHSPSNPNHDYVFVLHNYTRYYSRLTQDIKRRIAHTCISMDNQELAVYNTKKWIRLNIEFGSLGIYLNTYTHLQLNSQYQIKVVHLKYFVKSAISSSIRTFLMIHVLLNFIQGSKLFIRKSRYDPDKLARL